ncbi:MAG: proton-conducting transporter membrane subunit [Nannocystaceae bacterium]
MMLAVGGGTTALSVGRGEPWLEWLVFAMPTLPLLLTAWFGLAIAAGVRLRERTIARATIGCVATISVISLVVLAQTLLLQQPLRIVMLRWLFVPDHEIDIAFWLDPLSAVMAAMTTTIGFVVAWFSVAYLHREPGFQRYFMLVNLFLTGMLVLVLGDGFTLLFLGWEWVGLCSALLIGFFHERNAPVRAGARAFITNRFGDFGLLAASLFAAHEFGGDGWAAMMTHAEGVSTQSATVIGLCLWVAAMSKSAQLPFSSWMAHAVEGPTTSTGLFYGAIMAHAGVYLMLRTGPLVQHSTIAMLAMLVVGGATLIYAAAVGGAQPDAKGSIIYSTIAQLGGMFAACGLGAWHLVVVLMLLHAGLRAVQFLFAPSIIVQTRAAQHSAAIEEPAPSQGRVVHSGLIGVALLVAAWGAFGLSGVSWWYGPSGDRGSSASTSTWRCWSRRVSRSSRSPTSACADPSAAIPTASRRACTPGRCIASTSTASSIASRSHRCCGWPRCSSASTTANATACARSWSRRWSSRPSSGSTPSTSRSAGCCRST